MIQVTAPSAKPEVVLLALARAPSGRSGYSFTDPCVLPLSPVTVFWKTTDWLIKQSLLGSCKLETDCCSLMDCVTLPMPTHRVFFQWNCRESSCSWSLHSPDVTSADAIRHHGVTETCMTAQKPWHSGRGRQWCQAVTPSCLAVNCSPFGTLWFRLGTFTGTFPVKSFFRLPVLVFPIQSADTSHNHLALENYLCCDFDSVLFAAWLWCVFYHKSPWTIGLIVKGSKIIQAPGVVEVRKIAKGNSKWFLTPSPSSSPFPTSYKGYLFSERTRSQIKIASSQLNHK